MRIGLIGAGAIARRHVGVLAALDGVELAAVCDSDPARAASLAAGAAVYGSWQELLEHPLDAVFVCTPPAAHAEPAIAALRQGLAVYLEKPLARCGCRRRGDRRRLARERGSVRGRLPVAVARAAGPRP